MNLLFVACMLSVFVCCMCVWCIRVSVGVFLCESVFCFLCVLRVCIVLCVCVLCMCLRLWCGVYLFCGGCFWVL